MFEFISGVTVMVVAYSPLILTVYLLSIWVVGTLIKISTDGDYGGEFQEKFGGSVIRKFSKTYNQWEQSIDDFLLFFVILGVSSLILGYYMVSVIDLLRADNPTVFLVPYTIGEYLSEPLAAVILIMTSVLSFRAIYRQSKKVKAHIGDKKIHVTQSELQAMIDKAVEKETKQYD